MNGSGRERKEVEDMSKFERRMWFERLCQMRTEYRLESHVAVITIAQAIAYAEELLAAQPVGGGHDDSSAEQVASTESGHPAQ